MKADIENEEHTVVFIEYEDGIPFSVITMYWVDSALKPYFRPVFWDVFAESGDKHDLRIYKSGSGGNAFELEAPKYSDGFSAQIWYDPILDLKGDLKSLELLKQPITMKNMYGEPSSNPFDVCEITYSDEYCDVCGHHSVEFCDEHMYTDEDGNDRYRHDNSYAN
jgi:hypothetical protein